MREYVTIKYGPIAEEFCVFYDQLRDKYPDRNVYKNTNEFRLWVKGEISKYIDEHGEENSNDQFEQSENDEASSNNNNNAAAGQFEQSENDEANNNDYAAAGQFEQSENDEANNNDYAAAGQFEQSENDEANNNNNAAAGQFEQSENDEASSNNNNNAAAGQIEPDAIRHADREIRDIINELENGGVPLYPYSDDEGIKLDLFEELRGISEDFNYELEVDMDDSVFW